MLGSPVSDPPRKSRCAAALGTALLLIAGGSTAADLPRDAQSLAGDIRRAIETGDYARFDEMVFWKDAGVIKKRVVSYQIRSGFGRPVRSVEVEPFRQTGFDTALAAKQLALNMPVSHQIRVVYDEPALEGGGAPTAVYLVGHRNDVWRIALVVRKAEADDD